MYNDLIKFDNENLSYIIDNDGITRLKYIYKDEKKFLIKAILMEKTNEK